MSGAYENKGAMAATIVVAASDSLNKAAANYVCPGAADNVVIQAAIDALPAGGGKVVLLEGTYLISNEIEYGSNIEIEGQGVSTIIKLADNTNPDGVPLGIIGLLTNSDQVAGNDNVYIHDLLLDGNKSGGNGGGNYNYGIRQIVGNNIKFENLYIKSGSGSGIAVITVTNFAILNNKITDMGACGIGGDDIFNALIKGNIIDDTDDEGIDINNSSGSSGNIVITGNILNLSNNADESGIEISYNAYGMQRIIITNNIISEYYIGIFIKGSNDDIATGQQAQRGLIVSNNYVYSCRYDGIYFLHCYNALVSNNISELNTENGIHIRGQDVFAIYENITVSGNVANNNTKIGIFIERSYGVAVIGNNISLNKRSGIYFSYSNHSICQDNIVLSNGQGTYNTYEGIALNRFDYGVCQGNISIDPAAELTQVLTADALSGTRIIQVADTVGFRPGQSVTISDDTPDTENGVVESIDSLTQLTLVSNLTNNYTVAQNAQIDGRAMQSSGIRVFSTSNNTSVKNNETYGNVTSGILNEATVIEFDKAVHSAILDLSGAATDLTTFHTNCPCILVGYTILYTEASSADAGVNIRIGRYQNGVALDDDYFDVSVSEISKNLGYSKNFVTADLTNSIIAAGDTVTVGTAGGKVGTGEVMIILHIAEMAS